MSENVIDDIARLALAWWAALAAAAAALAGFYSALSKYTHLLPRNIDGIDTFTVLINLCMFVGLGVLFGAVCTFAVVWACALGQSYFWRLFSAIIDVSLGLWLRDHFPENHLLRAIGLLLFALAAILVTPLHKFLSDHEETLSTGTLFLGSAYFVFATDLHIYIWKYVTSAPDFRVVQTSSLGFWGWLATIIGAAIYLGLFAIFQVWHTRGKWWKQLTDSSV